MAKKKAKKTRKHVTICLTQDEIGVCWSVCNSMAAMDKKDATAEEENDAGGEGEEVVDRMGSAGTWTKKLVVRMFLPNKARGEEKQHRVHHHPRPRTPHPQAKEGEEAMTDTAWISTSDAMPHRDRPIEWLAPHYQPAFWRYA